MSFEKYYVIGTAADIFPPMLIKDLTDDQLRRRKSFVKEVKKGVYECVKPFQFKRGEVVCLDYPGISKAQLQILRDPEEIKPDEQPEILEELSKQQLIDKFPDLKLDMKMTKAEMLEEINTSPNVEKAAKAPK